MFSGHFFFSFIIIAIAVSFIQWFLLAFYFTNAASNLFCLAQRNQPLLRGNHHSCGIFCIPIYCTVLSMEGKIRFHGFIERE